MVKYSINGYLHTHKFIEFCMQMQNNLHLDFTSKCSFNVLNK